jgi:LysM repeat protein
MAQTYTVKKGDTLSGIAKQYGVSTNAISGHKSGNPNLIYPGEVLTIGGGAPAPSSPTTVPQTTQKTAIPTTIAKGGKQYGGWYDNPATGKNMRWWGTDTGGQEIWTMGEEPGAPTSADQVTPYLNEYQSNLYKSYTTPETVGELKTELGLTTARPAPISRVETREQLRSQYGVADLETQLADYKKQKVAIESALEAQQTAEEFKPVPLNVIAGRQTEEQRQAQVKLNYIARQISAAADELNTKYAIINQYIQDKGLDYQDAVATYDKDFAQTLQLYQIITGQKNDERSAARANLQMMANSISQGNVDYANLPATTKLMMTKLEVQAGLPVGFMSSVKKDPKADIIASWESEGQYHILTANPGGGSPVLQTFGTKSGTKVKESAAIAAMQQKLIELGGEDYLVSPKEWKDQRNIWQQAGYDVSKFDAAFKRTFVDWNHPKDYGFLSLE